MSVSVFLFFVAASVLQLLKTVQIAHFRLSDILQGIVTERIILAGLAKQSFYVLFKLPVVLGIKLNGVLFIEFLFQKTELFAKISRPNLLIAEHTEKILADLFEFRDRFLPIEFIDLFLRIGQRFSFDSLILS